jgi:hypothetical protein
MRDELVNAFDGGEGEFSKRSQTPKNRERKTEETGGPIVEELSSRGRELSYRIYHSEGKIS